MNHPFSTCSSVRRGALAWIGLVSVLLGTGCGPNLAYKEKPHAPEDPTQIEAAREFPLNLRVYDREGSLLEIHASESRPLLVHFWASWCAPCVEELRTFNAIREAMADTPLVFILISVDSEPAKAWAYLERHGIDTHSYVIDETHKPSIDQLIAMGVDRIPQSFVFDTQSRIVYHHYAADWSDAGWSGFLRRRLGLD